jgi:hypothetical protein
MPKRPIFTAFFAMMMIVAASALSVRQVSGQSARTLTGGWRIDGDKFSATFQLWCPNADAPCGSVVMRGEFVNDNRIKGVMTAFFDERDESRPTGFDTWPFNFTGDRVSGGQNQ